MNFQLGDIADAVRQTSHQFSQKEIFPLAEEIDKSDQFPRQLWPKLGELGLLGLTVSENYGGSGMCYVEHIVAMEEISRCSGAIGLSYGAHSNLCTNHIYLNGTEHQKTKFLPPLCSGEFVGALAMSEVSAGSDVVSMRTTATKVDKGYVLSGSKMWITNGSEADVVIVYAKTDPEAGAKGITTFIVEKNSPGFKVAQKLDKLGMRGSPTCELVFEDCFVPEENIMGEVNEGIRIMMNGLNYERTILAAGPLGIMQACLDVVLPYIHEREQFGKPIGEFQFIQGKVADMYTNLNAARSYVYSVAQACDRGDVSRKDSASAILFSAEKATQMALEALQCLGGNGYTNEYPTGRLLRDAKLYEIGAGTSEIRRMLIGREIYKETKP